MSMSPSEYLSSWLRKRKMRQYVLAGHLGKTSKTINRWVAGNGTPADIADRLAELEAKLAKDLAPPAAGPAFMTPRTHCQYYSLRGKEWTFLPFHPASLFPGRWEDNQVPADFVGSAEHKAACAAWQAAWDAEQEQLALVAYARACEDIERTWPHAIACRCWPCQSIAHHDLRYGTTTVIKGIPRDFYAKITKT